MGSKLKLAVWKFSSCDGCQLTILDCEDEILSVLSEVTLAYFPEASSKALPPPYDLSLVEGSVTTAEQIAEIKRIRAESHILVSIGACATAGGIQALRNFTDISELQAAVYPNPQWIQTLAQSRPIADFVKVDYALYGCPISKQQLLELLGATLQKRRPQIRSTSVCYECKKGGLACLMVDAGQLCLGPMTQSGCGALCPRFKRPCFGCFGPRNDMKVASFEKHVLKAGIAPQAWQRLLKTYNAWAKPNQACISQKPSKADKGGRHE